MGNRELLFTEYTVFVGDEEKVLDSDDGYHNTVNIFIASNYTIMTG